MNSFDHTPRQWFEHHDNLVMLTAWLAANNYKADNVADAVEKPWHWENEFLAAKYDLDEFDLMEVVEVYDSADNDSTMEQLIQAKAAVKADMEAGS